MRDRKLSIKDITDKEYDDAIDSYRPSHNKSSSDQRPRHKEELDVNGPPFSCLKIVDLPPFAKEQDIIKVFSSFPIMQIVMGRNPKKIYEAYVKFYREEDAKQALQATPSFRMAHKFVMVSKCTDLEFEAARNEYEFATTLSNESPDEPMSETKEQEDHKKSPSPVNNDNYNSNDYRGAENYGGNAIRSPVSRDPRFRNNQNESNGSMQASPISNYNSDSNQGGGATPSDQNGGSSSVQSRDPRRRMDPRLQAQLDNSCYLLLANIPDHLAEWDVAEWLGDVGAEPINVHLLLNSQRKFNGEVLVEFENSELARKAAAKDNKQLLKHIIRIELIPKSRYEEMLDIKSSESKPVIDTNNLRQPPPFLGGNNALPRIPMNGLGPLPAGLGRVPPPHMLPPMLNPRMMGGDRGNGDRNNGPPPDMNDPYLNARVILMENIPYKAGPNEIIDYFGPEFDLTPGSIMRRFNERGQPAGEAKVLFHSPADAKQAFNLRKGNKIMGRTIYLKPMI